MSTMLTGDYSGDLADAHAAYSAHVVRGDVHSRVHPCCPAAVVAGEYELYDGDLESLLTAFRAR